MMKFARHSDHELRVTHQGDPRDHIVTPLGLQRQRRAIVAQAERDAARYAAELADVDKMLEACVLMGVKPKAIATALPKPLDDMPRVEAEPMPVPPLRKRIWAFLTKPRGIGR